VRVARLVPAETDETIRVVVVDDHAVVRRGLFEFLGGEPDLEVVGDAAGGPQALELLDRLDSDGAPPDVVLMDLQMEPVDGIETTREIRKRFEAVEVVVLTSFGEDERVQAALEAGASGFLLKDADADEVAVAVRAAHRGELQLDPAIARRLTASLRSSPRDDGAEDLTARELEVLRLLGAGETNKGISAALGIAERTARTHVSHILSKLGLRSRTQAALWAAREGLAGGGTDPEARAADQRD
jgi:DNA-binding NarL/FixJ family response regulator